MLEKEPAISLSVSHTTRPPRVGEQYGRHYYFVERAEFEREIAEGIFLEHAEVHGNLYGTSRTTVDGLLAQSRDVLLEIDWQGARQIRRSKPDCVSVFILPPSRPELERRLRGRGSDSAEVIERRLHNSREEIAHAHEFDYIVVNDRFEDALSGSAGDRAGGAPAQRAAVAAPRGADCRPAGALTWRVTCCSRELRARLIGRAWPGRMRMAPLVGVRLPCSSFTPSRLP